MVQNWALKYLVMFLRIKIVKLNFCPPMSNTWNYDNSHRTTDRRILSRLVVRNKLFSRIVSQIGGFTKEGEKQICEKEMSEMICRHMNLQVVLRHVFLRQSKSGVENKNV